MRGVFFDDDHARAVATRLRRDGFEASLARAPFAGEDDDEDHPWVVTTDAPQPVLELLVDEYDGWLESDAPPAPASPLDLPSGPRTRRHEP